MACCLMVPSHDLSQCWLTDSDVSVKVGVHQCSCLMNNSGLWNLAWKKRDSRSVCSMEGKSWGRTGSGALPLGFNPTIPAQFFPIYSHPPSFLYFFGGTPHQKLWLFPHAHLTPLPIFHQKPPYPHPLTPSKHKAVDSYPFVSHQADHTFHTSILKYELEYPDIQC